LILERQMANVNAAILEAFQIVKRSAISRRVTVHLDLEENLPEAFVDSTRLQQIIWNLLTNAIKFTPANGTVTIRSRAAYPSDLAQKDGEYDHRWISIEVEDTGEGIPTAFLPHVWERFRQADASHTRRHNGLGIGLTLVKELAEAHGGMVDAKSEGIGALFEVRIPVNPPDQP
jgi:signal transduction histidine kinase